MARIEFAAKILRDLPIGSLLDVGCRDASLADQLPPNVSYAGADLFPDARGRVKYVGDITRMEIPERFDAVVALDILEHVESPSTLFDRLAGLANRYLLVSFPNCYDLKSRLRFVMGGPLGGKYQFLEQEPVDRHRWLMNRDEAIAFYRAKQDKLGMPFTMFDMGYGATGRGLTSVLGRGLSRTLPRSLTVETVCAIFEKKAA